jgi:L-methionine (R)-S-oxide reductase
VTIQSQQILEQVRRAVERRRDNAAEPEGPAKSERAAAPEGATRSERAAKARRAAELIRSAGSYRWVGVYDVIGDEIAVLAWSGPGSPAVPRFSVSQGLCGSAVRSGATVVVGDVTQDPRYLTTFGTTRSEIVVPVMSLARNAVGVIDVESERLDAFTDQDRTFLEACGRAMASLWE